MTPTPADARVTFVGHATVLLELGGVRVLTDPMLRDRLGLLRRHGDRLSASDLGPIDLVVVSHAHLDHLDATSLRDVPGSPTIVVPQGVGPHLRRRGFERVEEVTAGDRLTVAGVDICVVPARHGTVLTPLVPRSRPVGYVLDAGVRTYFAGDTGLFPGMAELGRVDLALLPVWVWGPVVGPGHLDPKRAAHATSALIRPAVAVPIHWATFYPVGLDRIARQHLREPGRVFARQVERENPETDVRVLEPAEATTITVGARAGGSPATEDAEPG